MNTYQNMGMLSVLGSNTMSTFSIGKLLYEVESGAHLPIDSIKSIHEMNEKANYARTRIKEVIKLIEGFVAVMNQFHDTAKSQFFFVDVPIKLIQENYKFFVDIRKSVQKELQYFINATKPLPLTVRLILLFVYKIDLQKIIYLLNEELAICTKIENIYSNFLFSAKLGQKLEEMNIPNYDPALDDDQEDFSSYLSYLNAGKLAI